MARPSAPRIALLALAVAAVHAPAAAAGQQTLAPDAAEARTFATSDGGWSSTVDYGGLVCIPGVTCPPATPSHRTTGGTGGASDGHLRDTFGTLLGVLATTTIQWSSPSFVAPAVVDTARLSVDLRPQIASLLAIGTVAYKAQLIDEADGTRSRQIAEVPLTSASASFSTVTMTLPRDSVVPGRTYRVRLDVAVTTHVSAVTSGNVDLDNAVLTMSDIDLPIDLTATAPATGALRVTGSVDPQGLDTDVVVDYGTTAAYGATTSAVTIPGSAAGAQPYTVPLSGLTGGATYHYRVRATNADGTIESADDTFVAPLPPSSAAPTVTGAANVRARTVTFTRAADVAASTVEAVDGGAAVVASADDADGDGEVALTLPDADGSYGVRVVRESDRALRSTSTAVPVTLDRVAPSTAALGLSVTPALSAATQRAVTFTRPGDADTVTAQVIDSDDDPVGGAVTVTGGSANVTVGPADGAYRVRLRLTDAAGNSADATSTAVTLDTTGPDAGAAPTVTGAGNERARTVTFARAGDATTVAVELLDGGGHLLDTIPVPVGSSVPLELPDADGAYGVRVRQTDAFGNSAQSPIAPVVLDRVAPAPGPAPTTEGDDPDALVVVFTRAPDTVTATVEVRDGSGNVVLAVPVPHGDRATIRLPATAGVYVVTVVQVDAAGNETSTPPTPVTRSAPVEPRTPDEPRTPVDPRTPGDEPRAPAGPGTPETPPACTPAAVVTDVAVRDGRVHVGGWTARAAGTVLAIEDGAGTTVGRATAGRGGRFTTAVRAPRGAAARNGLAYRVVIDGRRSVAVKLRRANALTQVLRNGETVTLRGRVDLARTGAVQQIEAFGRTGACGGRATLLRAVGKPAIDRRTGSYTLRVRAAAGDGPVVVRTRVTGARLTSRSAYAVR